MSGDRPWAREREWRWGGEDPLWGEGVTPALVLSEIDKIGDEFQFWYPTSKVTDFSLHKNLVKFLDWSTGRLFPFREHGYEFCGTDWHITNEDESYDPDIVIFGYTSNGGSFIQKSYLTPGFEGDTWVDYLQLRQTGTSMMDAYRICRS